MDKDELDKWALIIVGGVVGLLILWSCAGFFWDMIRVLFGSKRDRD